MPTMTRAALILLILLVVGCGLSAKTESKIKEAIAINAGHVKDESLPQAARLVALDNHDLLWSVLYNEGSISEMPSGVRTRDEARKKDGVQ